MLLTRHAIAVSFLVLASTGAASPHRAAAVPGPSLSRCSRQVIRSMTRLVQTDLRILGGCLISNGDPLDSADLRQTRVCASITDENQSLMRADLHARLRINRACRGNNAPICGHVDPLENCPTLVAHCAAIGLLGSISPDPLLPLAQKIPGLPSLQLAPFPRYALSACSAPAVPTSSTSTTTSTTTSSTTTTTLDSTMPPTASSTTLPPIPAPPQLRITEFLANPVAQSDSEGEYIEIHNEGTSAVDLLGLIVRDDGADQFAVSTSTIVTPGQFFVMARSAVAADGTADLVYGSALTLANSEDEIELIWNGVSLDRVTYDGSFVISPGRSAERLNVPGSGGEVRWCPSDSPMETGDFGTPGMAPKSCVALPAGTAR